MPDVRHGREEEFRRIQLWLTFSERIDRLVEATERGARSTRRQNVPSVAAAPRSRGLRARLATGLARVAVSLHREAAARAALRSGPDTA